MGTVKTKNVFIEEFADDIPEDNGGKKKKQEQQEPVKKSTGNVFMDLTVKKKEDTASSTDSGSSGSTTAAPTSTSAKEINLPENFRITEKSFLDRDIEKNTGMFLSNPNYVPTKEFDINADYKQRKQAEYDRRLQEVKSDITSSADNLANYTKKRVAELNKDIENNKNEIFKDGGGTGRYTQGKAGEEDRKRYAEISKKIAQDEQYKKDLKGEIASTAISHVVPNNLDSSKEISIQTARNIGRDIIKIADPEQESLFVQAEEKGGAIPDITSSTLERMGLDATKQYLQKLPQDENVTKQLEAINRYEKDFDERNFELTAQRVREKLGVYFYNKGRSGFWGYSGKNIEAAINDPESGLTDAEKKIALEYVLPTEKKLFFSTDIPGSGFFRSFKNAIDRSLVNTGNTLAGWVGARDDSDRAKDLLNQEVETSKWRVPGESPSMQSELSFLKNEEKKNGLSEQQKARKTELEKYVDVRNKWSQFRDGVGDLTGQVAEMALLTKGVGLGGRALTAIGEGGGLLTGMTTSTLGTALNSETVGLFLTSYLNAYDNYRMQALQTMPGKENAANRDAYAKVMSAVEGLSERIFNDVKVLKAFTKEAAPSIADITNRFINKEITQKVAREELQSTLQKYLKPFAKEFSKSTFEESFEEGIVDVADGISQSIFGGQPFDISQTGQQAVKTFLTTALYSPLVSGMAAHGAVRQQSTYNSFVKSAISDMATNPAAYKKTVEDLQLSGQITQDEANEKIQLINSASKYLKEIPESIPVEQKTKEGTVVTKRQMDYPEVSSYLLHRMNEGILQKQLETTNDEALKPSIEAEIKRSQEIRKGIINQSIGVNGDIQEVTDNPKKAEELGIVNAETLTPSELIGTPFEKEEIKLSPEEAIKKAADEGVLTGMEGEMIKNGTITPEQGLFELAKQKYGVSDDGTVFPEGGRDISMKTSLDVDAAVTDAFPTKESVISKIQESKKTGEQPSTEIKEEVKPITEEQSTVSVSGEKSVGKAAYDERAKLVDDIKFEDYPNDKEGEISLVKDGKKIATMDLHYGSDGLVHIKWVKVNKDFQGKGLSLLLYGKAAEIAKQKGMKGVGSGFVTHSTSKTKEIYKHFNVTELGASKGSMEEGVEGRKVILHSLKEPSEKQTTQAEASTGLSRGDVKQKELEDKVAEINKKRQSLRDEDGVVPDDKMGEWNRLGKELNEAREATRRGNIKYAISIKKKAENETSDPTHLTGEERSEAEDLIEQVIQNSKTVEEAVRKVRKLGYVFDINNADLFARYLSDRYNPDAPQVGNNKSSFQEWVNGKQPLKDQPLSSNTPSQAQPKAGSGGVESKKADIERRRQEELNIEQLPIDRVKRKNGAIGTQGVTTDQVASILKNVLGLTIPENATMKDLVNLFISDKANIDKLLEFTNLNPINITELPDGTIQINDGHHRAFLLDQAGITELPITRNNSEQINAKYDAELAELEKQAIVKTKEEGEGSGVVGDVEVKGTEAKPTVISNKKESFKIATPDKSAKDVIGQSVSLSGYEGLDLFVHREEGKNGDFVLTEKRTGLEIGRGSAAKEAADKAIATLKWQQAYNKEYPSIYNQINEHIDRTGTIDGSSKYKNISIPELPNIEKIKILENKISETKKEIEDNRKNHSKFGSIYSAEFENNFINRIEKRIEELKSEQSLPTQSKPTVKEAEQPTTEKEGAKAQPAQINVQPESVKIFKALSKKESKRSEAALKKIPGADEAKINRAKYINDNFEQIVNQLTDNNKLQQICP